MKEDEKMEDQIHFIVRQSVFPLISGSVMHPFIVYTRTYNYIAVMILHYRYCHLCYGFMIIIMQVNNIWLRP